MIYILDTDVAILLRDGDEAIRAGVKALARPLAISVVTRVELEGGVRRDRSQSQLRRRLLDVLLATLPVLPFDEAAADAYRLIVEHAGYSRRKLLDRMIAAQTLVHRAVLVTRNGDDFRDVPGLELLEW
ncbi:MAG: PIN domain-containing protein [Caulobacteraceae bacterium]